MWLNKDIGTCKVPLRILKVNIEAQPCEVELGYGKPLYQPSTSLLRNAKASFVSSILVKLMKHKMLTL